MCLPGAIASSAFPAFTALLQCATAAAAADFPSTLYGAFAQADQRDSKVRPWWAFPTCLFCWDPTLLSDTAGVCARTAYCAVKLLLRTPARVVGVGGALCDLRCWGWGWGVGLGWG